MNSETVLVVEDDLPVREMMAEIIHSHGYECQEAGDGLEALDLILENNFDVIISDIDLPKMDGLTLIEKAQEKKPGADFIVITGFNNEYSYDRVILAGARDYIIKPFTVVEFNKKVKRVLSERRMDKQNRQLQEEQTVAHSKMDTLIEVAADLTSELNFDRLLPLIIKKVKAVMSAERASLYIIDQARQELWTKVSEGVEQIRLPLGKGISGRVATTGRTLNIPDAWELPYFDREFDKKHQFRTRAVLSTPVKNQDGEMIGVLQIINKRGQNSFSSEDEHLLKGLTAQVGIALDNSLLHEELRLSFEASIRTLSAVVDAKHRLTAGHSQRVTQYALLIAEELNLGEAEKEVLKYAALLHDIGKIGIPDNVLLKNGPFTPEERGEMNKHPEKTKSILDTFHFPKALDGVSEVACYHHEKVNGKGYPYGLFGDQLPVGSKILAVADVFDALTSARDYPKYAAGEVLDYKPMPVFKAMSILEDEAGSQFDPVVVSAFFRCLPRALLLYRGEHFSPEYVDGVIRALAPDLLPSDRDA
jgi:response regulator RpfG family c-di-GMP phosphodiesterase